jgi:ribA/ribD-fused uncharacterized protein
MNALPLPDDGRILFFKRDREQFGFLSNFYEAAIELDGETWRSTEFYYQAQKSFSSEYRDAIRNANSPGHAKRLASDPRRSKKARKGSWFKGRLEQMRADWNDVRTSVMEHALAAKFGQNPHLRQLLLETGDAEIVEDSAYDDYWGVGPNGEGRNQLGHLLMQLRAELRPAGSHLVSEDDVQPLDA